MEELQDKKIETGATTKVGTGDSPTIDTSAVKGVVHKLKTLPRDALQVLADERKAAEIQKQNNELAREISQTVLKSKHLVDRKLRLANDGFYEVSFSGVDGEGKKVYVEEIIGGELGDPLKFLTKDQQIDKLHRNGVTRSIKMTRIEGGSGTAEDGWVTTTVEMKNGGKGRKQEWTVSKAEQNLEKRELQQVSGHNGPYHKGLGREWGTKNEWVSVITPRVKATSHADVRQLSRHIMAKI